MNINCDLSLFIREVEARGNLSSQLADPESLVSSALADRPRRACLQTRDGEVLGRVHLDVFD